MAGNSILVNQGTQTSVAGDSVGGTVFQAIKLDIGANGASTPFIGSVPNIGSVNVLQTGTLAIVSNLTNGSVILQSGTLSTGTLQNLVSGTINSLASGTITAGTVTNLVSGTINALAAGTITTGTVSVTTGTLNGGTLTNLVSGTINALASGTISGGTLQNVNAGTVTLLQAGTIQQSMIPVTIGTSYGVVGTTGAAAWGTIIAASGAGTKQYVSGVDIVVVSGTVEVVVTNIGIGGSTGAGVLARGNFAPGGGIAKSFNPVQVSGTNGTLSFWLGGAGTADITVQYWQGV